MRDSDPRTILVTGATGQVGYELMRSLQGVGRVIGLDRAALDLTDATAIRRVIRDVRPAMIINAAAYAAVDRAESDVALAHAVNAIAPEVIASEARGLGASLVHYSTDYVFDGASAAPYTETDATNPQNVYGRTKRDGEQAIVASGCSHLILRTSWVYALRAQNFLLTMLRLGAERDELRIVADQHGAPTWAKTLAAMTAQLAGQSFASDEDAARQWWLTHSGIYHMTCAGRTSWFDFAQAIFAAAGWERSPRLQAIDSASYPTAAKRPANSVLSNQKLHDTFGLRPPAWRDALTLCLEERRHT
jgi:dTDP-4-dehydrorhamnose reductase